jgi:hypothetical protein
MPILIIALIALAAFGVIGALLAAAVILETRAHQREAAREVHAPRHAA